MYTCVHGCVFMVYQEENSCDVYAYTTHSNVCLLCFKSKSRRLVLFLLQDWRSWYFTLNRVNRLIINCTKYKIIKSLLLLVAFTAFTQIKFDLNKKHQYACIALFITCYMTVRNCQNLSLISHYSTLVLFAFMVHKTQQFYT